MIGVLHARVVGAANFCARPARALTPCVLALIAPRVARLGRRTRFATPFVVILGCGQPHSQAPQPPTAETVAVAVAIDAAVDAASADAASADATVVIDAKADTPFRPPCVDGPGRRCNPPPPPPQPRAIKGRVTSFRVSGAGIELELEADADIIGARWGVFVDGDRRLPETRFKILLRGPRRGRAWIAGKSLPSQNVTFEPRRDR